MVFSEFLDCVFATETDHAVVILEYPMKNMNIKVYTVTSILFYNLTFFLIKWINEKSLIQKV